jgi:hypothetical protein
MITVPAHEQLAPRGGVRSSTLDFVGDRRAGIVGFVARGTTKSTIDEWGGSVLPLGAPLFRLRKALR